MPSLDEKNLAFSIIEIAIALTIVSLITTITIKVRNLIYDAKFTSIIADVEFFDQKINQFKQLYGGLPGDIANISSFTNDLTTITAGNGNGIIDNNTESLNVWLHLLMAGLIVGNFDGINSYIPYDPSLPTIKGAIPASKIDKGGFSVSSDNIVGLKFTLSSFPAVSYNNPILTSIDAYNLDKKFDDGNPNTGFIRAIDGDYLPAGSCIVDNNYNIANDKISCVIIILPQLRTSNNFNPGVNSCDGSVIGTSRISSSQSCPFGFVGYIIESCMDNGIWQNNRNLCQPIKCSNNTEAQEQINLPCSNTNFGNIQQTCSNSGVFRNNNDIIPQNWCKRSIQACSSFMTIKLACPIGYTGSWIQQCNNSSGSWQWSDLVNTCSPIICSAGYYVGDLNPNSIINPCQAGYNGNKATEACIMPLSGNIGNYRLKNNYCTPDYGNGSCSIGSIRSSDNNQIYCPKGQSGKISQLCNSSGYWETIINNCQEVKCGLEPIGSVRVATGRNCPNGKIGLLLEVCDYSELINYSSAIWQISTANCF